MSMEERIRKTKETYLPGMRIRLIKMDDFQAPPIGTERLGRSHTMGQA